MRMDMTKKKCFKCERVLPTSLFYKHKQMADGFLGKCIECTKKDVKEYRNNNIKKVRKYDRQRAKSTHRIQLATTITKRWRINNPLGYASHLLLNSAVKKGIIIKPKTCSGCGRKTRLEGHHKDYLKPLEVQWLCSHCHHNLSCVEGLITIGELWKR